MSYEAKPTIKPEFCTTQQNQTIPGVPGTVSNITEPTAAEKQYGDNYADIPPRDRDNWLRKLYFEWIDILDGWTNESKALIEALTIVVNNLVTTVNTLINDVDLIENRVDTLEGSMGQSITRLAGTTDLTGGTTAINFPSGFTYHNTDCIAAKINISASEYATAGVYQSGDISSFYVRITNGGIVLHYPDESQYQGHLFRVLLINSDL